MIIPDLVARHAHEAPDRPAIVADPARVKSSTGWMRCGPAWPRWSGWSPWARCPPQGVLAREACQGASEAPGAPVSVDDLADFKRPRAYEFIEALPRNAMGKVLKRELREE